MAFAVRKIIPEKPEIRERIIAAFTSAENMVNVGSNAIQLRSASLALPIVPLDDSLILQLPIQFPESHILGTVPTQSDL